MNCSLSLGTAPHRARIDVRKMQSVKGTYTPTIYAWLMVDVSTMVKVNKIAKIFHKRLKY